VFILAAALIVAGVALFVAAPLGIGLAGARAKSPGELQAERHEHERALAVQGLRELEFDREMGKLSDSDYQSMHQALEDRALTAMAALEKLRLQNDDKPAAPKKASVTALTQSPRRSAPTLRSIDAAPVHSPHAEPQRQPDASPSRMISFCPRCGTRAAADSKYCAQCGVAIRPLGAATARTE
jgi:cytochrome c-type biogenesis protein CcmI